MRKMVNRRCLEALGPEETDCGCERAWSPSGHLAAWHRGDPGRKGGVWRVHRDFFFFFKRSNLKVRFSFSHSGKLGFYLLYLSQDYK